MYKIEATGIVRRVDDLGRVIIPKEIRRMLDIKEGQPMEILIDSDKVCFQKRKPEGYDDLFIFVPEKRQIVRISEGSGDNLSPEDIEEGFVDYIYYTQYELGSEMSEIDGGQVMLRKMLRDQYRCMADCIQDVLDMAYDSCLVDCIILA